MVSPNHETAGISHCALSYG